MGQEGRDHIRMARQCGLMQRRRMPVRAIGVIPVRVLARSQQHRDNVRMTALGRQGQREVAVSGRCLCQQSRGVQAEPGGHRKAHLRAMRKQCPGGGELPMSERREHGARWIGPVRAEERDQFALIPTLAHNAARADQPQRGRDALGRGWRVRVQDRSGHVGDVVRHMPMPNRVLSDELQKARVLEVPLAGQVGRGLCQLWVCRQQIRETRHIARIHAGDSLAKDRVPDPLVQGPCDRVRRCPGHQRMPRRRSCSMVIGPARPDSRVR